MTESPADPPGPPRDSALGGAAALARDWITIWQSELSAAATDRERAQLWAWTAAQWAAAARAATMLLPAFDGPSGPAAAKPPAGAAPAVAAPDARDAAIARLAGRVEQLERRLAGLDRPNGR